MNLCLWGYADQYRKKKGRVSVAVGFIKFLALRQGQLAMRITIDRSYSWSRTGYCIHSAGRFGKSWE
jgi:hypothetical protein